MAVGSDSWSDFRKLTAARIALGRAGGSLPTRELLDFGWAHARARDAVLQPLDWQTLTKVLHDAGLRTHTVQSQADTRECYLRRPDLGRHLDSGSRATLSSAAAPCDLVIIVSDGLSARAVAHAPDVVIPLASSLDRAGWNLAPVVLARFGRVALQDEIGACLQASLALILIGERPGLGAADSLGAYLVFQPRVGRTDADRNCVSNIRPAGLTPAAAAATLEYLLTAARHRRLSGIRLKDERALPGTAPFLD